MDNNDYYSNRQEQCGADSKPINNCTPTIYQEECYNNNDSDKAKDQVTANPEKYSDCQKFDADCNYSNKNDINNDNIKKPLINNQQIQIPLIRYILPWTLIIIVIVDTILEIVGGYINIVSMIDNIAILGISITYLHFCRKNKEFNNPLLKFFTSITWFFGFGLKIYGLCIFYIIKNSGAEETIYIISIIFLVIRTLTLFFCIIMICPE